MTRLSKLILGALLAGLVALPCSPGVAAAQTASQSAAQLAQARDGARPTSTRTLQTASDAVTRVAQSVASALVTVKGTGDERPPQRRGAFELLEQLLPREFPRTAERPDITGSGFIVDPQGYVVTNHHIVDGATGIEVTLADGRKLPAQLVRSDVVNDVALLKVDATGLPTIPLGSSAALQPGEQVIAVGRPAGRDPTVITATVSGKDRGIELNVPISPEASGGPLVTMRGEAVGVTTTKVTRSDKAPSVGMAAPIDTAGSILQQFVAAKPRPSLGVHLGASTQALTPALARSFGLSKAQGAVVTSVDLDSPAELAGLQSGDVIVRFDGRTVSDPTELSSLLANTALGKTVELNIMRNRAPRALRVNLNEPADARATDRGQDQGILDRAGLHLRRLTPRLAQRLGIQEETGVVVTNVRPDSPAARAGIVPGDLIRSVNWTDVGTIADVQQGVARTAGDSKDILFRLERDRSQRYVVMNLG